MTLDGVAGSQINATFARSIGLLDPGLYMLHPLLFWTRNACEFGRACLPVNLFSQNSSWFGQAWIPDFARRKNSRDCQQCVFGVRVEMPQVGEELTPPSPLPPSPPLPPPPPPPRRAKMETDCVRPAPPPPVALPCSEAASSFCSATSCSDWAAAPTKIPRPSSPALWASS